MHISRILVGNHPAMLLRKHAQPAIVYWTSGFLFTNLETHKKKKSKQEKAFCYYAVTKLNLESRSTAQVNFKDRFSIIASVTITNFYTVAIDPMQKGMSLFYLTQT